MLRIGRMRLIRWSVAGVLITLHLVMQAPVWALIARIDLMGGSSGYHRFELVNQTILRFREWWLVGTTNQAAWGWDMWDNIDWYVAQCTSGGLLTLILFVAVIVYGFKRIGKARKEAETAGDGSREFFYLVPWSNPVFQCSNIYRNLLLRSVHRGLDYIPGHRLRRNPTIKNNFRYGT